MEEEEDDPFDLMIKKWRNEEEKKQEEEDKVCFEEWLDEGQSESMEKEEEAIARRDEYLSLKSKWQMEYGVGERSDAAFENYYAKLMVRNEEQVQKFLDGFHDGSFHDEESFRDWLGEQNEAVKKEKQKEKDPTGGFDEWVDDCRSESMKKEEEAIARRKEYSALKSKWQLQYGGGERSDAAFDNYYGKLVVLNENEEAERQRKQKEKKQRMKNEKSKRSTE